MNAEIFAVNDFRTVFSIFVLPLFVMLMNTSLETFSHVVIVISPGLTVIILLSGTNMDSEMDILPLR